MLGKKGSEEVFSIYWFVFLFIIAAAVVYMVVVFYGSPYDIREKEAKSLAMQIADCLAEGGYLKEGILHNDAFRDNVMQACRLNFNAEDTYGWKENSEYFFEIGFFDFNKESGEMQDLDFGISEGNVNLKDSCGKKGKNLAVCMEKSFYTLYAGESYIIKILASVRKTEKNA